MLILKIILGILMIISGCAMLTTPTIGSIGLCWFLSAFMLVAGIAAIIHFIEAKNAENVAKKNGLPYLATGVGTLILGIAAIVIALLARSSVERFAVFMKIITVVYGIWMILTGVSFFMKGIALKKLAISGWIAFMILGVLVILAGIYCIISCFTALAAIGTVIGMSMILSGFTFMFND